MTVTINGTGTIAGITSGGLGSNPIITQPELVSGVAGNGPAFSAANNATQAISGLTWTKVQFQTKTFDTANCFDNVTNFRFAPNVAGYYQFTGGVTFGSTPNAYAAFYKNGLLAQYGNFSPTTDRIYGTSLIYCNGSTDYVELYVYANPGATVQTGVTGTYFQAFLARAA